MSQPGVYMAIPAEKIAPGMSIPGIGDTFDVTAIFASGHGRIQVTMASRESATVVTEWFDTADLVIVQRPIL